MVLLTFLLVEHQLELIGLHGLGVEGTEGCSQVGVDVRLLIPVLSRHSCKLPISLIALLLVVIVFVGLSDDFAEQIEGSGAISTTILCILLLQVQEAVIVQENVEVFFVQEGSRSVSQGHLVLA